jgi:hypothetical protein|tara:strand:- start:1282 stop:1608 length:327 start_codon:yes stop_codon:yes gene_type:complete
MIHSYIERKKMKTEKEEQKTINSPGWEGLDATPNPHQRIEPTELDKLYQRVFSSQDGKKLLIHLKATYLDIPTWTPGYEHSYGYFRDGQNTIIREILSKIRRANYDRE